MQAAMAQSSIPFWDHVWPCAFSTGKRGVGGMNHILLPGNIDLNYFDLSARYGINAMELLINRIMNLGGRRHHLSAKIFGGARTLSTISDEYAMGKKNVEFVRNFLRRENIHIVSQDLGGDRSRKIYFHTDSGEVLLKRGKPVDLTKLATAEKTLKAMIAKDMKKDGDVTLF
jgi:chemotaxis protein CheD